MRGRRRRLQKLIFKTYDSHDPFAFKSSWHGWQRAFEFNKFHHVMLQNLTHNVPSE